MRILYDSKNPQFKTPFGTLTPGQTCTIAIHIPSTVYASRVQLELLHQDNAPYRPFDLSFKMKKGPYDIFQGSFTLPFPGLFFYFFRIHNREGFRALQQRDMEQDFSWNVPAERYMDLFRNMLSW